jgi:hypothetical protein
MYHFYREDVLRTIGSISSTTPDSEKRDYISFCRAYVTKQLNTTYGPGFGSGSSNVAEKNVPDAIEKKYELASKKIKILK